MARTKFKKASAFLHLWVGLITGVLVILISITGCIYVFSDELFDIIHHDVLYHPASQKTNLPLEQLWQNAQTHFGDSMHITDATIYPAPERNWEFSASKRNENAITYFGWIVYDQIVYVNPQTGTVAGTVDHRLEFFELIKMLHWSLLLHTRYGQPIVGTAVLLFLFSAITGLIIWWPKNYRQLREKLKVKWRASTWRIYYDLHRASAIYVLPLLFIVSITGLVWAFETVQAIVYVAASQSITPPARAHIKSKFQPQPLHGTIQLSGQLSTQLLRDHHSAYSISLFLPDDRDTTATLSTYIRPDGMVYYNGISKQYDRYSGHLLHTSDRSKMNNGEKFLTMNYDIHVGQVLGLPGKVLAFITSLLCALLPITGILIWWQRRKVEKSKAARA